MSIEEKDAFDTCLQTNEIVFGLLLPSKDCHALSKLAFYVLDQGLRASIAQDVLSSEEVKNMEVAIETAFKKA